MIEDLVLLGESFTWSKWSRATVILTKQIHQDHSSVHQIKLCSHTDSIKCWYSHKKYFNSCQESCSLCSGEWVVFLVTDSRMSDRCWWHLLLIDHMIVDVIKFVCPLVLVHGVSPAPDPYCFLVLSGSWSIIDASWHPITWLFLTTCSAMADL